MKDTESVDYHSLVTDYERRVQVICDDHIEAAKTHIQNPKICANLTKDIIEECEEIKEFREAAKKWKMVIDSRQKDRIVSFGEKLSCRFVAALLEDRVH